MIELLSLIADIQERAKEYGNWLEKTRPDLPNAFNMIYNDITLMRELLSYYYEVWSRAPADIDKEEVKRIRKENAERVIEITKFTFVFALSSMEYCLKELLKADGHIVFTRRLRKIRSALLADKRVHLRAIVRSCKEDGIIDDDQYEIWECLIEVRNAVVHNNAIADRDAEYRVENFTVTFSKGRMLRGRLDFFVRLLEVAIEHYYTLLRTLLHEE